MTDNYAISVVIPTYNRAHCIMRAVESVLKQTVPPFEILVVDDGSTDSSEKLFENAGTNVRFIKKPNGGVSSARNLGITLARGSWIAFLDSDDCWKPSKLETQIDCIRKTNAVACFTGTMTEDGARHDGIHNMDPTLGDGEYGIYPSPIDFITRSERHPMIQSLLVKKDAIIRAGGFDESLCVAEDTALFYELVSRFSIAFVNSPLVELTRQRNTPGLSDSIEVNKAARRYDCYIRVQAKALSLLTRKNMPPAHNPHSIRVIQRRLAYFLSRRAEIAHATGDHISGKNFAKEALKLTDDRGTFVRSFLLAYCYPVMQPRLKKKWPGSFAST